jgi:hypothetical protein
MRKQMFDAKKKSSGGDIIPATVNFKIDRKKGRLRSLSAEEKMLCALRKALASMSDANEHGCRFYIDNNKVQLMKRPVGSDAAPGQPRSYNASGRCKIGVCHPEGHKSSMMIEFSISFKDTTDDRGLEDVIFFDPTTIDEIPRNSPLDVSALK